MLTDPRHTPSSPDPRDAERTSSAIFRDVLRSLAPPSGRLDTPPVSVVAGTPDQPRRV